MQPIQARESIMRTNEITYGSGNMNKDSARSYIAELSREAAGAHAKTSVMRRPASLQEAAAMGGGVVKVAKK